MFLVGTFTIGSIVTGKIVGIQPYGAFVALDEQTQGLVHISEVAYEYVENIESYVHVGEEIRVRIISVDKANKKISLSLKTVRDNRKVSRSKRPLVTTVGFETLRVRLDGWIKESTSSIFYK